MEETYLNQTLWVMHSTHISDDGDVFGEQCMLHIHVTRYKEVNILQFNMGEMATICGLKIQSMTCVNKTWKL